MAVNISVQEVGGNVVWTSSGTLNVAGLTFSSTQVGGVGFDANNAVFGSGLSASADVYTGAITKPASFGTGGAGAASSSGSYLSIQGIPANLWVPAGYTSGAAISNTTTYTGTLATLGLTVGTYVYSWGSGGNADSITITIGAVATPTPTTTQTPTQTPTPSTTPAPVQSTVQITSNNYNGQIADITFYPCSGGTISLGEQTIPYSYESSYYYGQYSLFFSAYNSTCTYDIVCPSPTPTNTSTPTTTPTNTPTPTSAATPSGFTVTISQVGPDVVWSGSGSFNLTALTSAGSSTIGAGFQAGQAIWAIGPNVPVDTYSGTITYPTTFGAGGVGVTSSSGSTFGVLPGGSGRLLYVPSGYISNTTISGSATYASQTIVGMGLTPGTYTWSWGSGGNTSTLTMIIG